MCVFLTLPLDLDSKTTPTEMFRYSYICGLVAKCCCLLRVVLLVVVK